MGVQSSCLCNDRLPNGSPDFAKINHMADAADHTIDAIGLVCPEPLMIVRNKVRGMAVGETVSVVATDPSTVRDFTNFCRFMGHDLARSTRDGELYRFVIRKGERG